MNAPCFSGFIAAHSGRDGESSAYSIYPGNRTMTPIFLTSNSQWVSGSFFPPPLSYPSPAVEVLITEGPGEVAVL